MGSCIFIGGTRWRSAPSMVKVVGVGVQFVCCVLFEDTNTVSNGVEWVN